MSDTTSATTSLPAAAQSMRDSAKWLVGGVAATAAGIFAGSSLTAFGALKPAADTLRFGEAVGGLLLGFLGLACIFGAAVRVLTRESMTLREIALFDGSAGSEIGSLRDKLVERYRDRLPTGARTFKDYVDRVDAARQNPESPDAASLLARAREDNAVIAADAGFLFVRARFEHLVRTLRWATVLAIIGFGLFAWAANPPKPEPAPPAFSLTIRGSARH